MQHRRYPRAHAHVASLGGTGYDAPHRYGRHATYHWDTHPQRAQAAHHAVSAHSARRPHTHATARTLSPPRARGHAIVGRTGQQDRYAQRPDW
eukprot:4488460-Alexandrium_andersonii.AAC.1